MIYATENDHRYPSRVSHEATTEPPPSSGRAKLTFIRDELMLAAHAAGMPGNDAARAVANVLHALILTVHDACEAREYIVGSSYAYEFEHGQAMLDALEAACRLTAAERVRRQGGGS